MRYWDSLGNVFRLTACFCLVIPKRLLYRCWFFIRVRECIVIFEKIIIRDLEGDLGFVGDY